MTTARSTLTNCTVSGNSATGNGGGLYTTSGRHDHADQRHRQRQLRRQRRRHCTTVDGTVTLGNTIVAGNTATTSGPDALGTFASQGNNLIGETDGSSGWVALRPDRHQRPAAQPPAGTTGQLRRPDPDDGPAARQPGHRRGQ